MHVVRFSELVLTGLWALQAEQHALRAYCPDICIYCPFPWKILAHLLTWAVSFFVALFMGVKTSRNFMFFRRWLEVVLLWSFSILNYFFTWFHSFSECMCQIHFGLSFSLSVTSVVEFWGQGSTRSRFLLKISSSKICLFFYRIWKGSLKSA